MRLTRLSSLTGTVELVTGLHIGSGNVEMHIGGTDNPVIKNPITDQPYIPGSSIKGKMRSLLEWRAGLVTPQGKPVGFGDLRGDALEAEAIEQAKVILRLFGGAPEGGNADDALVTEIGPTRLSFWDCPLEAAWVEGIRDRNLLLTETKMENSINRIKGVAENPRNTERVPAGARFDFRLTLRVHDEEDLLGPVLTGLKLVEMTGLGGSGSRGYGKLKFQGLALDGQSVQDRYVAAEV